MSGTFCRNRAISGSSVWMAASFAPMSTRPRRRSRSSRIADSVFFSEAHEPLPVVLQDAPGVGQRAALRRPIEELLAELVLEALDRLADRRLRPVHLRRRARKAALLGHGQKDPQGGQVHKL